MGKLSKWQEFLTWLRNLPTAHHRIMAGYLARRGWVVFYLEEQFRECKNGTCWMDMYRSHVQSDYD